MASASVVGQHPGQHRLDSEPPLFVFKLTSARKKIAAPRKKASREKMMFRRSSGSSGDSEAVSPEGEPPGAQALSPGPVGETAASPRSRDRDREEEEESADCDRQTGHMNLSTSDRNSNRDWDSNHNTSGGRRETSGKRSSFSVRQGDDAQRHREFRQNNGHHQSSSSSLSAGGESGFLPLERLTQARSGVVRLARQEPSRREAWSIFPHGQGMDPRVRTEKGEGHRFEAKPVTQDWCDACSRKVTAQALKCQNCSYTCHLECQRQVQLDCNQRDRQPENASAASSHSSSSSSSSSTAHLKQNEAKEEEGGGTKDLSAEEVQTRIEEYNAQVGEIGMNLASDGSYTGFIKVQLRLSRPVTVSTVEAIQRDSEGAARETGSHDQAPAPEGTECGQSEKKTSFYLPCDCVKHLHISSLTTTREVIQSLLKKFMVLDNPRKFALYRLTHRDGQDLFQKLPLCERPLLLRLIAGPDPEQLTFVLKENETGEVEWHAFSVPELQNFLVILEKEEAERVRAVEQKYAMYRKKLQQALQQHDP